ncbi:MAG: HNH endonuclease [Candidatus Eremiobacteraeota bacterium]|nr:HNH endonuclease [Candidatus Eremiobacteraeota bacterium]
MEQRGELCWNCGWRERHRRTLRVPLHIDHIDGNALNSRPENLQLLCPNCHSLTDTFGSLNRGNGRMARIRREIAQSVAEVVPRGSIGPC